MDYILLVRVHQQRRTVLFRMCIQIRCHREKWAHIPPKIKQIYKRSRRRRPRRAAYGIDDRYALYSQLEKNNTHCADEWIDVLNTSGWILVASELPIIEVRHKCRNRTSSID